MTTSLNLIVSMAEWILKTSLKASVLVVLILIIQFLFRRKMSARWQHGLWLLLIARLILPLEIESRISLFNLVPAQHIQSLPMPESEERFLLPDMIPAKFDVPSISSQIETKVATEQHTFQLSTKKILALVWLLGVVAFSYYAFSCNFRLWRKIRLQSTSSSRLLFQLLEQCKKQMKITRPIALIEMEGIRIPVLFGIVKPKILLPGNLAEQMTADQIQHIFLHELAHYQRKDVLIACLATILQIIHWFNPIIWFAFYRMRSDRELACDEMTLNRIGAAKSQAYGKTIISLLETMTIKFRLPVTVSIIETKKDLKRRLAMIANFKKRPFIWSIFGIIILFILTIFSFTAAQKKKTQTMETAIEIEDSIGSSINQANEAPSQKSIQEISKKEKAHPPEVVVVIGQDRTVRVNNKIIDEDSMAQKLKEIIFDENTILTLKPEQNADQNAWFNIQMQLQSIPIKRIKFVNAKTGRFIITPQYNFEQVHKIVIPDLIPRQINGKYGFSNQKFQIVIEPKFDQVQLFQDDLAGVKIGEKWGFINRNGDLVIEAQFDQIHPFEEGLAAVMLSTKWGFIDKTGKMVIDPIFEAAGQFYNGLALVTFNGKRGFIDQSGQFVIQPIFDDAYGFSEGLAGVQQDGKWGFIDEKGQLVIAPQFDRVDAFSEGLALVKINGKFGYIDKSGKFAIKPQYENADSFSEGLAAVQVNGKYGYIDKAGHLVIEPQFDFAGNFMAGLAHVIIFEKPELNIKGQGFEIDKAGNIIGKK